MVDAVVSGADLRSGGRLELIEDGRRLLPGLACRVGVTGAAVDLADAGECVCFALVQDQCLRQHARGLLVVPEAAVVPPGQAQT